VNRESVRNQDHVPVKRGVVLEVEEQFLQDANTVLVQDLRPAGDAVHLEEGVPTAPDLDTEDVLDPDPCEDRLLTAEDIVVIQEVTQGGADAVLVALTEEEVVAGNFDFLFFAVAGCVTHVTFLKGLGNSIIFHVLDIF